MKKFYLERQVVEVFYSINQMLKKIWQEAETGSRLQYNSCLNKTISKSFKCFNVDLYLFSMLF